MQQRKNSLNALAYFTILGWLFSVLISSDSQKSRIHLTQSLFLNMAFLMELPVFLLCNTVWLWIIGCVLGLAFAIIWVTALIDAAVGRECYFYEFPNPEKEAAEPTPEVPENTAEAEDMDDMDRYSTIQNISAVELEMALNQILECADIKQAELKGTEYKGKRVVTNCLCDEDVDVIYNGSMNVLASLIHCVALEKEKQDAQDAKKPVLEKKAKPAKPAGTAKKVTPAAAGTGKEKPAAPKAEKPVDKAKAAAEKAEPAKPVKTAEESVKKAEKSVDKAKAMPEKVAAAKSGKPAEAPVKRAETPADKVKVASEKVAAAQPAKPAEGPVKKEEKKPAEKADGGQSATIIPMNGAAPDDAA